jgi:hypothetical protein
MKHGAHGSRTRHIPIPNWLVKRILLKKFAKVLNLGYIPDANRPTIIAGDQRVRTVAGEVIIYCSLQFTGCFKGQSRDAIVASVATNAVTTQEIGTVVGKSPFSVCVIDKRARLTALWVFERRGGNIDLAAAILAGWDIKVGIRAVCNKKTTGVLKAKRLRAG